MPLVVTRKIGQSFWINEEIQIQILSRTGNEVRIMVACDKAKYIVRRDDRKPREPQDAKKKEQVETQAGPSQSDIRDPNAKS